MDFTNKTRDQLEEISKLGFKAREEIERINSKFDFKYCFESLFATMKINNLSPKKVIEVIFSDGENNHIFWIESDKITKIPF